MAAIQWRPVPNALTTPDSYSIRFVSRGSAGIEDLAADIAQRHPNFSKDDILTILKAEDEAIMGRLLNGEQVTKEGSFSWFPSFTGRLDSNDPLPPLEECLHLNTRISAPYLEHLRQNAQTERLSVTEKLPLITSAEDTVLGLRDVLRSDGMLRITGSNLLYDRNDIDSQCLIKGTRNGSAIQSRVGTITNSEIVLMPDIPTQREPWNNEYQLSLTTRYTEHGTLRTGIYNRLLRSPLTVTSFGEATGILTDKANSPYVSLINGTLSGPTSLRIRVIQDLSQEQLLFSLIAMQDQGAEGDQVTVTENGEYTLPGFSGSTVGSLNIRVDRYSALWDMIRNNYSGQLIDILKLEIEPG